MAGLTDIYAVLNSLVQQLGRVADAVSGLGTVAPSPAAYTVANLPAAASSTGSIARVTDGTAGLSNGTVVTGGGGTPYLVWSNGTAWTVVGT